MEYITNFFKQPLVMAALALLLIGMFFFVPESIDFIFGGVIFTGIKFLVYLAFSLIGVKIVKAAIAFFKGGKDETVETNPISTGIICGAVYLSVFILMGSVIISG